MILYLLLAILLATVRSETCPDGIPAAFSKNDYFNNYNYYCINKLYFRMC